MPSTNSARVFAYGLDGVEPRYKSTAARTGCTFFHDDGHFKDTPCGQRPGFQKLLEELRPGDELVIWSFVALGNDLEGILDAIGALAGRGAYLRVPKSRIGGFCIPPSIVPLMGKLLPGLIAEFKESHRETTRQTLAWRRGHGFATKPVPGYGKRFVPLSGPFKTCRGTLMRAEIWDETECAQILQIRMRRSAGESYASIARDFLQRGERRSNGDLWAKYRGRGRKRRIDIQKIRNADRWYVALLASGQDLQGLPVMPLGPRAAPEQ